MSAKATNIAAIARFTHGWAANRAMPAAPTSTDVASPAAVKVPTIPAPKSSAFLTAALRSPPPCRAKYEAVMGTMGKTHGVTSANAPAEMASQKKAPSIMDGRP